MLSLLGPYPWQGSSDYFLTSGDKIRFFFEKGVLDERGKPWPELAPGKGQERAEREGSGGSLQLKGQFLLCKRW